MKVNIYGASDDLLEIEGDISEEYDVCDRMPKLYVYSDNELQFVIKISFVGCWLIQPILDEKSFDESNSLKCKNWKININMISKECIYSMGLSIDSGLDNLEITRRRKK